MDQRKSNCVSRTKAQQSLTELYKNFFLDLLKDKLTLGLADKVLELVWNWYIFLSYKNLSLPLNLERSMFRLERQNDTNSRTKLNYNERIRI